MNTPIADALFAPLWAKDTPPTDEELHEVTKRFSKLETQRNELLEALEVVNNSIETTGFFRNSSMHGMIQNALRKAKGETP